MVLCQYIEVRLSLYTVHCNVPIYRGKVVTVHCTLYTVMCQYIEVRLSLYTP